MSEKLGIVLVSMPSHSHFQSLSSLSTSRSREVFAHVTTTHHNALPRRGIATEHAHGQTSVLACC